MAKDLGTALPTQWLDFLLDHVLYMPHRSTRHEAESLAVVGAVKALEYSRWIISGEVNASQRFQPRFESHRKLLAGWCRCGKNNCAHQMALAMRLLGEGVSRQFIAKEAVEGFIPERWLKKGAVLPKCEMVGVDHFFHLLQIELGADPDSLEADEGEPFVYGEESYDEEDDEEWGGEEDEDDPFYIGRPRTLAPVEEAPLPDPRVIQDMWREFLALPYERREDFVEQKLRATCPGLPQWITQQMAVQSARQPNPVVGLEALLRALNHNTYTIGQRGRTLATELGKFLRSEEAEALAAQWERRIAEEQFLRWLERDADSAAAQVDRLEVELLTGKVAYSQVLGLSFRLLLTSRNMHRRPRNRQAIENLHREFRKGKRNFSPASASLMSWLKRQPLVPSPLHPEDETVFAVLDAHDWLTRWNDKGLLLWEGHEPFVPGAPEAHLSLVPSGKDKMRWAVELETPEGPVTKPLAEVEVVQEWIDDEGALAWNRMFIRFQQQLYPLQMVGVPPQILRSLVDMEELSLDMMRNGPYGQALYRFLREQSPRQAKLLVQEVAVRPRLEFRLEGKKIHLHVFAQGETQRFYLHPQGWRPIDTPVAQEAEELVQDAPGAVAEQAVAPVVEERPLAFSVQPQQEEVEPIERWLRESLPVNSVDTDTQPADYVIKAQPQQLMRLHLAWNERPKNAEYFGNPSFLRLVQTRSISPLKIKIEESGIDFLKVSVEWAQEMDRISLEEVETALRVQENQLVQLTGGLYRREELEAMRSQLAALAGVGLAPEAPEQRMHALHLAGEAGERLLQATEASSTLGALREHAQDLVKKFKGIPPVKLQKDLGTLLRPYQHAGVEFLVWACQTFGGALLADEMGLGKTLQVLAALQALRKAKKANAPSLVVCPASVAHNWLREAKKFTPDLRVLVLERGAERHALHKQLHDYDVVVKNYALTRRDADVLKEQEWFLVCVDEAQTIKNPHAAISQTVKQLQSTFRIALTGTPIENSLADLWSIMDFAVPGYLPDPKVLDERVRQLGPSLGFQMLRAQLRPVLLRRLKQDVAPELPERIEERRDCPLEPAQKKLYLLEVKAARELLAKTKDQRVAGPARIQILAALTKLRQICCDPAVLGHDKAGSGKTAVLLETLAPLMEQGEKVLIFSQFVRVLHRLEAELKSHGVKTYVLTGETTNRGELVDAFEQDPGPAVFLISLKAGGTGLNLTSAAHVILFDPWWNPAVEAQAIDRTHRIGQDRTVVAIRLVAEGTIEDRILELQEKKRDIVKNVFESDSFNRALTREDFQFLLGE